MSGLSVSVTEVRQVFSTSTRSMNTTLVIDVFGHPVEVAVDDPILRAVIDAAVAVHAEGIPVDDVTLEVSTVGVPTPSIVVPRDPTIPVPEVTKVPSAPNFWEEVEGDNWTDSMTGKKYRFTDGEWLLVYSPSDGDVRISADGDALGRYTTEGIPQEAPKPSPPRVVPVQNVDEDGFEAM